ncbi:nitroreductase family deazaflavin-dependent oxidoreductase [Intrasporangium sp. YIM S08009]|uniref:nitroreductase family deazaflavin-dependent oxidoreductase n=1 Tax=Intrasporangium zincisolvens TaxID=3080018 RepID=UPI002B05BC1D|nr:nitroreductase family deazaflavin-dependent oxidoreductase [Intrasporangium sp. YIM S08009]
MAAPIPPWLKALYAAPNALYDHGLGWVLGHRFLRLEHVGRHSGRRFTAVVEALQYDPATGEAVVMAGYGHGADWLRNVRAAGSARVEFAHGPRPASVRVLGVEEAAEVLAGYERRHPVLRPALRPYLSSLAGWRYDGSPDARRRLVSQLPMVAFRPLRPGVDPHG